VVEVGCPCVHARTHARAHARIHRFLVTPILPLFCCSGTQCRYSCVRSFHFFLSACAYQAHDVFDTFHHEYEELGELMESTKALFAVDDIEEIFRHILHFLSFYLHCARQNKEKKERVRLSSRTHTPCMQTNTESHFRGYARVLVSTLHTYGCQLLRARPLTSLPTSIPIQPTRKRRSKRL
jgi:hypothetical protein